MIPPAVDPKAFRQEKAWSYSAPFVECRFDPQGRFVFASAQDFTIQRWELSSGKQVALRGHESWVRAMGFDPGGEWFITGGYDGQLIWWPAQDPQPQPHRKFQAHDGWIRALAINPDGKLLATVGNDLVVKLWELATGKLLAELTGHESHIYNVAFHPGGQDLATCDLKGVIKHWSVPQQKLLRELKAQPLHKYDTTFRAHIGGARAMRFDPQGKFLACGGITEVSNAFAGVGKPAVVLLEWSSGKQHLVYKAQKRGVVWGLVFHPQQFWLAVSGGAGGWAFFFRGKQAAPFHTQKLPASARGLDLHPNQVQVAICDYARQMRIYTLAPKNSQT